MSELYLQKIHSSRIRDFSWKWRNSFFVSSGKYTFYGCFLLLAICKKYDLKPKFLWSNYSVAKLFAPDLFCSSNSTSSWIPVFFGGEFFYFFMTVYCCALICCVMVLSSREFFMHRVLYIMIVRPIRCDNCFRLAFIFPLISKLGSQFKDFIRRVAYICFNGYQFSS